MREFTRRSQWAIALAAAMMSSVAAYAQEPVMTPLRPDQVEFRALYKELVETNTTLSAGSCTLLADKIAAHLKAAGFSDKELTPFSVPEHPKEGGLVAVLAGRSKTAKPMLLLGHLDVVEAKREDWTRDPFVLVEENGYFYGRGSSDDKAHAAIFTDALTRLKQAGTKLRRPLKLALTCGEETGGAFNGANWLVTEHKDWIDAQFALNEGSVGLRDASGKKLSLGIQAGEKVYQDFRIEASNPGGHSSRPRPDNAIYSLAAALVRIGQYEFPVQFTDTTRAYFAETAKLSGGEAGAAMMRLIANSNALEASAIVSKDPTYHSMLRTTCVATRLDGGHANNALAQRAGANINCRMFPGDTIDNVLAQLIKAGADPSLTIAPTGEISPTPAPPPLTPLVYGTAKTLAQKHFPGVPMLPAMSTGATDGRFLNASGIPTYGVPGRFSDPDGNGVHGLNERKSVEGLYEERDYLFELIQAYANSK
jgi:acetylornithine deacetylase/succinyl-diaminopimelate desuccinylase-like protein